MDVVYPVRDGANEELRYSLRSLANVPHGRVWIFGGGPAWITGVQLVPRPRQATKYLTATGHLRAACEHPDVSDPFQLWNDDFYATHPVVTGVPQLHGGPIDRLIDVCRAKRNSPYVAGLEATRDLLHDLGHPEPLSYELHVPLVVHKAPMLEALETGWHLPIHHPRTMYGNLAGIGGAEVEDVKVYPGDPIPYGPWLSSSDTTYGQVRNHLDALFPHPCRYEHG